MDGPLAAAVLQGRGPDAPWGCPPVEDDEELHCLAGVSLGCLGRQLSSSGESAPLTHVGGHLLAGRPGTLSSLRLV